MMAPMKSYAAVWMLSAFFILPAAKAASDPQSHTLYGDLKVDEKKNVGIPPLNYTLVLYAIQGRGLVLGRTTVTPNGRYRFFNVPNGEYELAVEAGGTEVARISILLQEKVSTELRRDIELEVRPDTIGAGGTKPAAGYARGQDNAAQLEKAQQAVRAKDYPGAVALLRQIVATEPKDFEAWTELGSVLFRQGNLGEAGKAFNQALKLKPAYELALLNLGKLQLAQKNYDGGVETLTKLVELQPRIAEAQFLLGEAYLQVKKGSKAVVCLNEALKLDPIGMADAHMRLAALYNAAGYKDRAAAEYEQFLSKRPDYPEKEKLLKYIRENKKLSNPW
jgi:tetratricopeptide (TPR) repeat protein